MEGVTIREGKKEDIPRVFELIRELALYEKAPDEVENTVEKLIEDGFGANPLYGLIVAESEGYIIGMSLYYFRYSTWKGKRLYIEDIIVTEKYRGNGIGHQLFEASILKARETKCSGMTWLVLEWNEPAIHFYKKYNPGFDPEWIIGSLTKQQVIDFK